MPATTALVRLAPPSFIAGYTFHFTTKQRLDEAALKAQLTLAGYTPREPGRLAGRVRGARRPDRPVPDGLGGAVPRRPVRRRDRLDPHLRSRHAAKPLPGARGAPPARARVPDGRAGAQRLSRALARALRGRPDQGAPLQGHRRRHRHRRHRVLPAALLRRDGDGLRLPRRRARRSRCTARSTRRCSASGPTRASAIASSSTTASGRSWRPRRCSSSPRSSSPRAASTRSSRCARKRDDGAALGDAPCPTSASTAARPSR